MFLLAKLIEYMAMFVFVLHRIIIIIVFPSFSSCSPEAAEVDRFQNTWASVWIKMSSAWLCFVVYLWTLLAPLILRSRDFGYGAAD